MDVILSVVVAIILCSAKATNARALGVHSPSRSRAHGNHGKEAPFLDEGAWPLIAFRNPKTKTLRLYGQYNVGDIRIPGSTCLMDTAVSCSLYGEGNLSFTTPIEEAFRVSDWQFTDVPNNTYHPYAAYYVDCNDTDTRATEITLRLADGHDYGRRIPIQTLETELKGKVAACSQPLHTNRDWLPDWVDHNIDLGVSRVYMNVPMGAHIDELFSEGRDERIKFNGALAERSPLHVGKERLKKFSRPGQVEWVEYWPAPQAVFYGEEFMFTICQYRAQYEFEYVMDFDIDEFITFGPSGQNYSSLPHFLDTVMDKKAAAIIFRQVLYPQDCPTSTTGPYASRFTRGHPVANQAKAIARPNAIFKMHVHGPLAISKEWQEKVGIEWALYLQEISPAIAYLKHIRPTFYIQDGKKMYDDQCYGLLS